MDIVRQLLGIALLLLCDRTGIDLLRAMFFLLRYRLLS
jgi:hypothetical protein